MQHSNDQKIFMKQVHIAEFQLFGLLLFTREY